MKRGRGLHLLALLAPPLLIGLLLLASTEAFLRVQRFGGDALLHPLRYMAPAWRATDCFPAGPAGELMTPRCDMRYKGVDVSTNSAGLNDREVDESAPHYRVVVLGDSVTMAAGVEARSIYHALLEDRLNRELGADDFVEFYNYGRGGRSTVDQIDDLRAALARWPLDAALVALTPGNVWANLIDPAACDPDDTTPPLSAEQLRFYAKRVKGDNIVSNAFALGERITGLWSFHVPRNFFRSIAKRMAAGPNDGERVDALEQLAIQKFRRCATRMRAVADAAGIELVWTVLWYSPNRHAELLHRELTALGEPVSTMVDIEQNYASSGEMVIYPREVHPNAAVNADFARELWDWLSERGWIAEIAREKQRRSGELVRAQEG